MARYWMEASFRILAPALLAAVLRVAAGEASADGCMASDDTSLLQSSGPNKRLVLQDTDHSGNDGDNDGHNDPATTSTTTLILPPEEPVDVTVTAEEREQVVPPHRHVKWHCASCYFVEKCPGKDETGFPDNGKTSISRFYPASLAGHEHDQESDFYVLRVGLNATILNTAREAFQQQDHSMIGMMLSGAAEVRFTCHKLVVKVRYIRKELRELTEDEWHRYTTAMHKFKYGNLGPDYEFPNYDSIVAFHATATLNPRSLPDNGDPNLGDQAHFGPAFALWHSTVLLEFERGLQVYDPSVAAHYWDYTNDPLAVFTERFYGEASDKSEDGCALINGPFQNWTISYVKDVPTWTELWAGAPSDARLRGHELRILDHLKISRLGRRPAGLFMSLDHEPGQLSDVKKALEQDNYFRFFCKLFYHDVDQCEGRESNLHGQVHGWGAGFLNPESMLNGMHMFLTLNDGGSLSTSPNDPFWFGHHSMVERIHQAWYAAKGSKSTTDEDPCGGYANPFKREGHDLHDVWEPKVHTFRTPDGESSYSACLHLFGDKASFVYNKYF